MALYGWMDDYLLELRNCRIGAKPDWGAEEKKGGAIPVRFSWLGIRFDLGASLFLFTTSSRTFCFHSLPRLTVYGYLGFYQFFFLLTNLTVFRSRRRLFRKRCLYSAVLKNMADYNFGGSEEENAEIKKLEAELVRCDGHLFCLCLLGG